MAHVGRKAKDQNSCPHPFTKQVKLAYGHYKCGRCDKDLLPAGRRLTHRHSPRVTLTQGDRIHVKAGEHGAAFKGTFLYAQDYPSGLAYTVAEKQRYMDGKITREGTAAIRTVRPDTVRRDDGVRARNRREQEESESKAR